MKVESLGRPATFYMPAVKYYDEERDYTFRGKQVHVLVDEFLMANYNGYSVRGPFKGHWRPSKKEERSTDTVVEIKVSFKGKERIPKLQKFLAGMCKLMEEKCLYLETGEDAWLIYPEGE
jgi:hypothetical protein